MANDRAATGRAADERCYARFVAAVAARQLDDWLPGEPARIADLSADRQVARRLRRAGHRVLAGAGELAELPEASVDLVVAEGLAAGLAIAAEQTFAEAALALRPGGRLYATVDSLLAGLGELAELGRWAELANLPAADVLLVPDAKTLVRRCFAAEEIREILTATGLVVHWIRPRTVLAPEPVNRVLASAPERLGQLVSTELALAADRSDQPIGRHLVVSAGRA